MNILRTILLLSCNHFIQYFKLVTKLPYCNTSDEPLHLKYCDYCYVFFLNSKLENCVTGAFRILSSYLPSTINIKQFIVSNNKL